MYKNYKFTSRLLAAFLLFCLVLLSSSHSVQAQAGKVVSISAPVLDQYPEVTCYFSVINRDGTLESGLTADQVSLFEDGIEQELTAFQELNPGIQLVTAFNISNPFSIQDINGISRFSFIKDALIGWADLPVETGEDKVSLISNDGLEHSHLRQKAQFKSILEEYDPQLRESESNYNVLAQAISLASDPVDQPGMKRVVLLFTGQPTSNEIPALDSLTSQAIDSQVQIYTVLISSPAFFNTAGAVRLQQLSAETGGAFLTFSGEESFPDLSQLLDPLRSTYQVKYRSQIVTQGVHALEVSAASTLGENIGTREFFLDIQPPNPILISPPREIVRELPEENPDPLTADYQPESIQLDVLLDFPDSHPRELEELIFRVDGEVIERKTEPPFDHFIWDLTPYQNSATHFISLEAIDIMGLSRSSQRTPVEISVIVPPPDLSFLIRENMMALAGLAGILAVGLTIFFLIAGGRIQPGAQKLSQKIGSMWVKTVKSSPLVKRVLPSPSVDPGTGVEHPAKPFRLIAIGEISQQLFPDPIKVQQGTIILGSHPPAKGLKVYHPSVIKQHAQIISDPDGRYQILDLGSTAGTWVNYKQITGPEPQILKDGDIIHIGEAVFRFQVRDKKDLGPDKEEIG